jgi:hypothetical protein
MYPMSTVIPAKKRQTLAPKRAVPPLREMREATGMSLSEAARRARIPHPVLSRAERGLSGLSLDSLFRLLWVLDRGDYCLMIGPFTTNGRGGEW